MNKEHNFLITLKMDGKTIATRNTKVVEVNEHVIYSLRLNKLMKQLSAFEIDRKGINRGKIILNDPKAPICINCEHCEQNGFLFICTQFQWPENGRIVGLPGGIIYYHRKGCENRSYENTPKTVADCELFSQMIPESVLSMFF